MMLPTVWRKTTQDLAPSVHTATEAGAYDLYPGFAVGDGKIHAGFPSLAERLRHDRIVIVDGFIGVFWEHLRAELDGALQAVGVTPRWVNVANAMKPPQAVEEMITPFLGGDDPIFGTRYTGSLRDFFDAEKLAALASHTEEMTILYGCGAALAGLHGTLVYVDLPKNELQFRSRAGSVTNLGAVEPASAKAMYKRYYFVDWPALNAHKADLLPHIDIIVDGQRPVEPLWMTGGDLRAALTRMSRTYFRVRPWFEPGAWGGQWIKEKIPQLPQNAVNYAWSFELIVPENGLMFESDGRLLEVSFDMLMFHDHRAVLGACAETFQYEFPIRFDFLDTFDGGNLSVQCHPHPDFIRREFGETFTQDETYYILDAGAEAQVYLGFQEGIDPVGFRHALEESQAKAQAIDIEQFVQHFPAHKHGLFLIPHGTVHCSGKDVMVLEISATPYIFTFKMYDWMRLDLDGKPRPINIERAFANLNFSRQGRRVEDELIAKPAVIARGDDWQLVHLPTHADHFYDVHRFEFDSSVEAETGNSCHVMSLVEGTAILLETADGLRRRFSYAETFVVPAAAGRYRLVNEGAGRAMVVKAFVK
jgi:mannose-6-phosphate isomerase class I